MPNGRYGSNEEWDRLEAPLLEMDPALEEFAMRHGMSIGRNHHSWPERSLRWGSAPERLIQIYLADEKRSTWNIWLCASEDRAGRRFWKQEFLRREVPMREVCPVIEALLDEALEIVGSWSSGALLATGEGA